MTTIAENSVLVNFMGTLNLNLIKLENTLVDGHQNPPLKYNLSPS